MVVWEVGAAVWGKGWGKEAKHESTVFRLIISMKNIHAYDFSPSCVSVPRLVELVCWKE